MALLQIFLPDNWLETLTEDSAFLQWRLTDGVTMRIGESAFEELPKGADVELILPASRILLTRVKLPPGNVQRLGEVARYAAEDRLLGDPETIHAAVGNRASNGETAIAIVHKEWLSNICNTFKAGGYHLIRATSEVFTTPYEHGTWSIVWHGQDGWVRTDYEQGLALDVSALNVPYSLSAALEEAKVANNSPQKINFYPAKEVDLPDLAHWTEQLDIDIEVQAPWSWEKISAPITGINLLQGELTSSRSHGEVWKRYRVPGYLAIGIFSVYIIVGTIDWAWLTWQKYSLNSKITQTFKSAFPNVKNIVNPTLQMQRNLNELKEAHGEPQPGDLIPMLAATGPAANALSGQPKGIQFEKGKLQLDIILPQLQSQEVINQQLSAMGIQAKAESVNQTNNGVMARINFESKQ